MYTWTGTGADKGESYDDVKFRPASLPGIRALLKSVGCRFFEDKKGVALCIGDLSKLSPAAAQALFAKLNAAMANTRHTEFFVVCTEPVAATALPIGDEKEHEAKQVAAGTSTKNGELGRPHHALS